MSDLIKSNITLKDIAKAKGLSTYNTFDKAVIFRDVNDWAQKACVGEVSYDFEWPGTIYFEKAEDYSHFCLKWM